MVVLFLTVMIAMILLRALRKDIANYNDASFLEGKYVQLFITIISSLLLSHSVTSFIIFSLNFFCQFFPTVRNKYLPFLFVSFLIFFLFSPTLSLLLIFFYIMASHLLLSPSSYLYSNRDIDLSQSLFLCPSFSLILSLFPSLSLSPSIPLSVSLPLSLLLSFSLSNSLYIFL